MKFKVMVHQAVEVEALSRKEVRRLITMWSTGVISHEGVTSLPITHSYSVHPQRKVKIISIKRKHDLDVNQNLDAK